METIIGNALKQGTLWFNPVIEAGPRSRLIGILPAKDHRIQ